MKKHLFLLIFALCSICASALSKDSINAVTMASYEQQWLDHEATIALTNNTSKPIHNVAFLISYFDMKGNQLDYKDFSYDIEIAPGMTKSLDVPAFNPDRYYHYYKTPDSFEHPAFKIKYELKDFNMTKETIAEEHPEYEGDLLEAIEADSEYEDDSLNSDVINRAEPILFIFLGLVILGAWIGLYALVAVLAKNRNRSAILWLLLSFIASPLLIAIILLCLGKSNREEYYK